MHAVLVTNRDESDPGHVGHFLERRGFSLVDFTRESHDRWGSLGDASLLVSFGSSWSTYWDAVSEPVRAEQRLMTEAIGKGTPVLGICFGAQQLSTVLGGIVARAPRAEIGWHTVEPAAEPTGGDHGSTEVPDWLCSDPWMQWHYDSFTVPPGAQILARSDSGPQAFRHALCLGVQFHPEATESIVSRWSHGEGARELEDAGIGAGELLSATRANQEQAAARCEQLVDWFLTEVAQVGGPWRPRSSFKGDV